MAAEIDDRRTAEPPLTESVEKADFAFWVTVACWTAEEAAMLSIGLDPEIRDSTLVPESAQLDSLSYRRRRLLILRAIEAKQLPSPLTPRAFVEWAKQRGIEISESLRLAVADYDCNHDQTAVDGECHPKIVASMQKMILGMAVRGYRYDPTSRGDSVSEIVQDFNELGLSLSENTIRSRLKEAYDRYGRQSVDDVRRA